jgi:DNA-binding transcriptional MerR regulator
MKDLTVKQVAAISGVTVRTLHHYDEIGLLAPAHIGANGYRYYGRAELLRLQRILFHRELGVPLGEIAALLDREDEDQVGVLMRHRGKLEAQRERYRILIETIDRTVAAIRGETHMSNAELYRGFSTETQAAYEAWLIERYGDPMKDDIARSRKLRQGMSEAEQGAVIDELKDIETALAEGMKRGVAPDTAPVDRMIRRHRAWVARAWDGPCSPQAYAGLADLYLSHPDFVTRYEAIAPGFAVWLTDAMKVHAVREARA